MSENVVENVDALRCFFLGRWVSIVRDKLPTSPQLITPYKTLAFSIGNYRAKRFSKVFLASFPILATMEKAERKPATDSHYGGDGLWWCLLRESSHGHSVLRVLWSTVNCHLHSERTCTVLGSDNEG